MQESKILELISKGRTDFIVRLLQKKDWKDLLKKGYIKPLQWLVYYNDVTGLRLVIENGGTLESINIHKELGNAAFFGHWKVCDFFDQSRCRR